MPFSDPLREINLPCSIVRSEVSAADGSDLATPQTTTASTPYGAVNTFGKGYIDLDVAVTGTNASVGVNPGLWNPLTNSWSYTGVQTFSSASGTTITSLRIDANNRPLWPKITSVSASTKVSIYEVGS